MGRFLNYEADTRSMELEIYDHPLPCVVQEPTTEELIGVENKLSQLKGVKRIEYMRQVGMKHLISIEGLCDRNGKPLVMDPDAKGYDPDWKRKLKSKSLGTKIAVCIASKLYEAGGEKPAVKDGQDDDGLNFDDDNLDNEVQEPGEKQPAAGGKQRQSGGK